MNAAELKAVVEYMESERGVEREVIIRAIETALQSATEKTEMEDDGLRIEIDRKTFELKAYKTLSDGSEIESTPRSLGRIAAQTAKQVIMQKIRNAEKEIIFEEYKDRLGEIITGTVTRFDRSDVIIELEHGEAVMTSKERVPTEEYEVGERVRALILAVRERERGPEIMLSRNHPDFVRRLFELEVSEISDGTMDIKGIAREAGYRSKVAVISHDERVDPVGACVGMRGMRVKNIVRELSGEKIDIVRWSEDIHTLITNALAPARLKHVDADEETQTVTVTVEPDQLSLAIGKRGQNARLTSKLTGWRVDIQKDEESMDFEERVAVAVTKLAAIPGIGEEFSDKLVFSGFLTLEGILAAELSDLASIEGISAEQAKSVWYAAEAAYTKEHGEITE
ncbi:transcription termination factor NusA [Pontiella sulfatireligans]|uniref:Transcription termination/antitermination protein NusA n=1 Tax=Pontiella sulfatireligans TaxID=2750658 RepID=A0A6C2UMU9_9BACT|nr:transcription termination factor NusA [Pontiella sulfatireligans]VGO21600.1 Transcription termination/antitermination protein NusA [Pontiella sulfatireligans]